METKEHPGQLRDRVTSPGGTAIAGLATLEKGGLRTTLINAVEVATNRSRELGEMTIKNFSNNGPVDPSRLKPIFPGSHLPHLVCLH